jgi:hypothetical protein
LKDILFKSALEPQGNSGPERGGESFPQQGS